MRPCAATAFRLWNHHAINDQNHIAVQHEYKLTGNYLMKYNAVVFDLNGTLIWDTALHNRIWDDFLERHSIFLSDEEKNRKIHGKPNQDILKALFDPPPGPDAG